jgi:hypothetical protein
MTSVCTPRLKVVRFPYNIQRQVSNKLTSWISITSWWALLTTRTGWTLWCSPNRFWTQKSIPLIASELYYIFDKVQSAIIPNLGKKKILFFSNLIILFPTFFINWTSQANSDGYLQNFLGTCELSITHAK